jgi:hypothetical protein
MGYFTVNTESFGFGVNCYLFVGYTIKITIQNIATIFLKIKEFFKQMGYLKDNSQLIR